MCGILFPPNVQQGGFGSRPNLDRLCRTLLTSSAHLRMLHNQVSIADWWIGHGAYSRSSGTHPPAGFTAAARTSRLGRERERMLIHALLRRDDVGLLTLTGAGGTGTTRLALAVASTLVDTFADGVYPRYRPTPYHHDAGA